MKPRFAFFFDSRNTSDFGKENSTPRTCKFLYFVSRQYIIYFSNLNIWPVTSVFIARKIYIGFSFTVYSQNWKMILRACYPIFFKLLEVHSISGNPFAFVCAKCGALFSWKCFPLSLFWRKENYSINYYEKRQIIDTNLSYNVLKA